MAWGDYEHDRNADTSGDKGLGFTSPKILVVSV